MYLKVITLAFLVPLYALPSSTLALTQDQSIHKSPGPTVQNANHIFNAIHSSMRQWGSSLNHNGMSFFLAHIPAGTELYHGRGDNITVTGMEWLAFEPEHAMNFAAKFIRKPPPPDDQDLSSECRELRTKTFFTSDDRPNPKEPFHHGDQKVMERLSKLGEPMLRDAKPPPRDPKRRPPPDFHAICPGWMHSYRMKHDIRVVYIDGEAAAKSGKGTTDSQEFVLAYKNQDSSDDDDPQWGPPDHEIAVRMCTMATEGWGGHIDGFIRMEHGFELILCDFEKSANLEKMVKVDLDHKSAIMRNGGVRLMTFLHAVGARYRDIGGERVRVDYDDFVTAFATDINLFENNSVLPRLNNINQQQRDGLLNSLAAVVTKQKSILRPINWQSIADMVISRYSDPLHVFTFDNFQHKFELDTLITLLISPFINYDARNATLETFRCTRHFIPDFPSNSTAGKATLEVSAQVCSNIFAALDDSSLVQAQSRFKDLMNWLQWTSWKECRPGCSYDEFCLTAIWPIGDVESHEHPYCVTIKSLKNHTGLSPDPDDNEGYWGLASQSNHLPLKMWNLMRYP